MLLRNLSLPPCKWEMGRVVQCHPGTDGLVRVVTVKTAAMEYKRPIVKLCILPVNSKVSELKSIIRRLRSLSRPFLLLPFTPAVRRRFRARALRICLRAAQGGRPLHQIVNLSNSMAVLSCSKETMSRFRAVC